MKRFKIILKVIFAAAFLMSVSCVPESCFDEMNALIKATLITSIDGKNVAPEGFTMYGLEMDDTIYYKEKSIKMAEIPLNPSAENCSFLTGIDSGTDTVTFFYSTFTHLVSKECGYTFYHYIDSLWFTKNPIDTVIILNRYITTSDATNIQFYY